MDNDELLAAHLACCIGEGSERPWLIVGAEEVGDQLAVLAQGVGDLPRNVWFRWPRDQLRYRDRVPWLIVDGRQPQPLVLNGGHEFRAYAVAAPIGHYTTKERRPFVVSSKGWRLL